MDREATQKPKHDDIGNDTGEKHRASAYKTRLGLKLFVVYSLVYAGFVGINTVNPETMETLLFSGLNLAVVYGFGLILLAVLMGLIYNQMCTRAEDRLTQDAPKEKSKDDA